jgi:hypothetical protein
VTHENVYVSGKYIYVSTDENFRSNPTKVKSHPKTTQDTFIFGTGFETPSDINPAILSHQH